ncbi:hypothetical protein [Actinoallomurus acaciae]|uniref:Uncharacterized protein n=1 Tax=Actinoallomurus acaciae TaxID=502577 RepID=A0ABV5YEV3_9ACTN
MARRSFEERIAARQAAQGPLKEGRVFEHGPAKFLFVTLLVFVFVIHVGGLIVMMAMGMH